MDRCSRIAELLLIENEVLMLENKSSGICLCQCAIARFDYWDSKGVFFTPIEKIMYAILLRVKNTFNGSYGGGVKMYFDCQRQIGQYRVDFFVWNSFSNDKIIIECDGHDFHEKTKEQAKHDKERDRFLTSQGYKILRYTGTEIYNDFVGVEDELKELLDIKVGNTRALFNVERGNNEYSR